MSWRSPPVAQLLPADEAAHAVVAGLLGLELLASLDGDRRPRWRCSDRAQALGDALDRLRPLAALLNPGRGTERGGELMQTDVVTGAFGYSGAAIARELRAAGHQVRTLTGHPRAQIDRGGPGEGDIDTRPLGLH